MDKPIKLTNRSNVKKFALACAKDKFERVSGEFFNELDAKVAELITTHVNALPAKGKTIFGFSRALSEPVVEETAAPAPASDAAPASA